MAVRGRGHGVVRHESEAGRKFKNIGIQFRRLRTIRSCAEAIPFFGWRRGIQAAGGLHAFAGIKIWDTHSAGNSEASSRKKFSDQCVEVSREGCGGHFGYMQVELR